MHLLRAAALAVVSLAIAHGTTVARAQEPKVEVVPDRAACVAPFEIRGSGLPANRGATADILVDGMSTGSVAGQTDAAGQFFSPIPMILLPCADGGTVTVALLIEGEFVPHTAEFEVADAVVAPPTSTPSPTVAADTGSPRPPEVGTGPGGGVPAPEGSALWVLIVIGTLATAGIVATWMTRPRT